VTKYLIKTTYEEERLIWADGFEVLVYGYLVLLLLAYGSTEQPMEHVAEKLVHLMAVTNQREKKRGQGSNIPFKGMPPMT
jgi:hypothetical protein